MRSWARSLPACWSATSTPPTTTMTVPSNAAGPTCCGTSTTCVVLYPKDDRLSRWAGAVHQLYRQAVAFAHPEKQPDKQRRTAHWPWKDACWRSAVPSWMTHWRSRPGYAGAWRGTSRNSASGPPEVITTPPSAASFRGGFPDNDALDKEPQG